jgi:hypothetical protein
LAIDIDFPAAENCGVRVAYDPAALKFVGVSNRTGGLDELQMGEGTIRWSSSRPQRVSVFLAARTEAPSRVSVSFMAGGSSGEGAVELPGLD